MSKISLFGGALVLHCQGKPCYIEGKKIINKMDFKIEAQYYKRFHDSSENSVINRFHERVLKFLSFSLFYIFYHFPLKEVGRPL